MSDGVSARLDRVFRLSLALKALDGAFEIVGGVLLLALSPEQLSRLARAVTQHELSQDPHDVIARHVLHAARGLTHGTTVYAGIYLLSHGVAKVVVIVAVLRDRLWAYPAMIVLIAAFIAYQLYRIVLDPTIGLTLLTIFDAFVVWLTWREYQARRTPQPVG